MTDTATDRASFMNEIDEYVERVWPEMLEDIAALVAIPSVEDLSKAAPGAPWGPGPKKALVKALEIANKVGLDPTDADGYIGFADLSGASDVQIATICHADVVPEGPGWHHDPFKMEVKDGWLIGRGVLDDKGPLVVSLYAAKFFADKGKQLPYTLRCIIGTNEETDLRDVEYYNAHYPQPAFLFTPDAEFPVCCGEKGGFSATFRSPVPSDGMIEDFEGGTAGNAIPSLASVTLKVEDASQGFTPAESIDIEVLGPTEVRLTAHGIGGHAAYPEGTKNAIGMLIDYLWDEGLYAPSEKLFLELERRLMGSTDGSTLGIAATDDVFEPLTCIGGTIKVKDGVFEQTMDARFPKTITAEEIQSKMETLAAEHGCTLTVDLALPVFYIEPSSPEVQACIDAYNERTGKHKKPFTIGGGTYAREFKNAVSFGVEDTDIATPSWAGAMHGPDEAVSEDLLKDALAIYIDAIDRLMKLDLE